VITYRPAEAPSSLYLWKQGGTIEGTWRVLVNEPDGAQTTRFAGPLEGDALVPLE
jgi:hypothetical protein